MLIAHVSDIHFGAENTDAIDAATEAIEAAAPDVLVVSGDLTQRGKRTEFDRAATWLDHFSCGVLSVPGNHDVPLLNLANRAYKPFSRYDKFLGQYSSAYETETTKIVGLNTARGWQIRKNWAEGSVNLSDLSAILSRAQTSQILTCHHPFLPIPGAPLKTRTRRGQAASQLIAGSAIELLLTGHVHKPNAVVHHHDSGAYLNITSGTLSRRLRDQPPSFNFIRLSTEAIEMRIMTLEHGVMAELETLTWSRRNLMPLSVRASEPTQGAAPTAQLLT